MDFKISLFHFFRISKTYIDEAMKDLERNPRTSDSDLTILKFLIKNERMPNAFIVNLMAAILFAGVEQVRQVFNVPIYGLSLTWTLDS
jgi:hypothetical protein